MKMNKPDASCCAVCGVDAGGIGGLVRSREGHLLCSRVDLCDERVTKRYRVGIGATLRTIDTLSAADLQLRAHELRREAGEIRRSSRELEAQAVRLETMADELRQLKLPFMDDAAGDIPDRAFEFVDRPVRS